MSAANLPGNLKSNPMLSRWIRVLPDGMIEISPGKVEIGQGILTALAQVAADELDVDLGRIRLIPASTTSSPNEGMTAGSLSVQESGMAIRYACAEARAIFLEAAAERLDVPADALSVDDGVIRGPGNRSTSYFDLADDGLLDHEVTGTVAPKPIEKRRLAGASAQRLDLPDKIFGARRFVHDRVLPEMLQGRVLRPPRPGAVLVDFPSHEVAGMDGVKAVVRDGNFAGVVADTEPNAAAALNRLRELASWDTSKAPQFPDEGRLMDWLRQAEAEIRPPIERVSETPASPARTVRREFSKPYIAHASIGPSCAIAQWRNIGAETAHLHVWTHSQGIYNLRKDLALVFDMAPETIIVEHTEGAGCYGHNGADDVALDAALLARASGGHPVRVQWSREDELGWAPFGPAMLVAIEADLDAGGEICGWRHDIWSNGHTSRPGRASTPTLLAAPDLEAAFPRLPAVNVPLAAGGGSERNAIPPYDFPWRVTIHHITDMPIRTSAMRSLGAIANVFAAESLMDELAAERGEDPVAFRLRQLPDPRARAVIESAAERFGWAEWQKREGLGRGIAYARYKNTGAYCAAVAEIEAEAAVRVRRLVLAVDVGEVINPDGVANQIEGGAIQATSWALKEAVRFDRSRITSTTWEDYPILRFSEVPAVEVVIVGRPDCAPLGAGEAAQGPVAAAIANAVFDAIGVRVRDLPLTPEHIIAAMELGAAPE